MVHSVLIADDHPVVLSGLKTLIDQDADYRVVAAATDGAGAIEAMQRFVPDIAVLDFNMPAANGLEVLRAARSAGLATRIVILAAAAGPRDIHALVTAGIAGLLFKESAPTTMLECLAVIAGGGTWLPEGIDAIVSKQEDENRRSQSLLSLLTAREIQLVRLAAGGRSNKEMAYDLGLSEGTVKVHLNNIFRKLDISTRAELTSLVSALPAPSEMP